MTKMIKDWRLKRLGFRFGLEIRAMEHKGGEIMSRGGGGGCLSRKSELKITRATVF